MASRAQPSPGSLPAPSPEALDHAEKVRERMARAVRDGGGWIGFDRYMEMALYEPGLGYYSAGARKLGAEGDFTTAPELSALFGETLARQLADLITEASPSILEVGAGSGALAGTVLAELEKLDRLPAQYLILELSADLRERSRDTLAARVPHLLDRVAWLSRLPPSFRGTVIGNEVLDAMPVHLVQAAEDGSIDELGVTLTETGFGFAARPARGELLEIARALDLPPGYRTEIGLAARGFIKSLAETLERGVAIFIDYGFPAKEFFHADRRQGTLMCHYRHRAHADPFFLPGLQDITAHVDFSAVADAASAAGLKVAGFASQAQFLIHCGITDVLSRVSPEDSARYLPLSNQANRLLSPAEMGDLFKVIALTKGCDPPLRGFARGDRSHAL